MNNVVVLDIDDVVVDWYKPFGEFVEQECGIAFEHHQRPENFKRGTDDPICLERAMCKLLPNYEDGYFDIDQNVYEVFGALVEVFNTSEAFSRLPFVPGAILAINELRECGYEVHGLTACGKALETRRLRMYNVGHLFDHVHFTDYKTGKKPFFKNFYKDSNVFYLDNSPKHCVDAAHNGLIPFLFSLPENKDIDTSIQRISSWEQVPHIVAAI